MAEFLIGKRTIYRGASCWLVMIGTTVIPANAGIHVWVAALFGWIRVLLAVRTGFVVRSQPSE
ncbi:MAG: hypothetical protein ACT4NL_15655 [Pseudomarimonas sp.]